MRKLTLIVFATAAASASLSAFAEEPATTPAQAATSTPATAPASKPVTTVAPTPAATTPAATPVAERESAAVSPPDQKTLAATTDGGKPFKPPMGFRLKIKGGQSLYCKETTPLGTRFAEETCMTMDQLKDFMARADIMRQDMTQHQAICSAAAGCASN
jgi:hypothetical protein